MDVREKVNKLIEDLNKGISDKTNLVSIMEAVLAPNLSIEDMEEYTKNKNILLDLKAEIEKRANEPLIAEKIKGVKLSGQDRFLTNKEERIKRNILLVFEREIMIVRTFQKVTTKEVSFSKIEYNLDKYILLNFYRTICELTLRLFTDTLLAILEFIIRDNADKEELADLNKLFKRVLDGSVGLDDLKTILGKFDKKLETKLDLTKLVDSIFLYKEGEGFSLRNNSAHEKVLFAEVNNDDVLKELQRVNRLNTAFIMVFYFDVLGSLFTEKDIELSKDLFGK